MRSSLAHAHGKTYSRLSGVIAIYKPQGLSTSYMIRNVKARLLQDLNTNYRHEIKPVKQFFLGNWSSERESLQQTILQNYWPVEELNLEKEVMDVLNVTTASNSYDVSNAGHDIGGTSKITEDKFLQTYTKLSLLAYSQLEVTSRVDIDPPKVEAVSDDGKLAVVSVPSFVSHPAVCGQPYTNLTVKCVNELDKFTCGVQLYIIGHHYSRVNRLLRSLVRDNLWQKFEVIGRFGLASDDFTVHGKLREKSTYTHIRRKALEQVIQVFTRGQRKLLFKQLNADLDSEDMYNKICNGTALPHKMLQSYIHRTSVVTINLPFVKLEMLAKKCNGMFCRRALHQIGLELRSNAAAEKVRLVGIGPITVDHSMLLEELTVERVLGQLHIVAELLSKHRKSSMEILANS